MPERSRTAVAFSLLFILLAAAAVLMVSREATAGGRAEGGPVVIRNVRLFDGDRIVQKTNVVFAGGRVTAVGPKAAVPTGAEVIDGTGKTLLPGLIDAHVHIITAEALSQSLVFGVTAVIDMFTSADLMKALKADQAAGRAGGRAFFVSPGILATAPGGHGTQFGIPIPTLRGPADARAFADDRVAVRSDFVHIILDDSNALEFF